MKILRIKIILLVLLIVQCGYSQSRVSVGADLSKVLVHTGNINFESTSPAYGIHIAYSRKTNPQNDSYEARGTPVVGLNLYYADYNNKGLGKTFGFYPSLNFIHKISKRLHMETSVGIGFGYATKFFNRQPWEDTLYNALGSHWNNFTRFSESVYYSIKGGDQVSLGVSFNHVSSSSASAPNFGLNSASVGLGYHFINSSKPPYGKAVNAEASSHRDAVHLGYTFTTDKQVVGLTFPIYTIGYKHHWVSPSRLASWFVGAEVIHNAKSKTILDFGVYEYRERVVSDNLEYYIMLGREWYMGNFGFCLSIDVGYSANTQKFAHLEKPTLFYYPFNTNYSTQSVIRNLYLGVGLCTRLSNAQYLDLTIGTYF